MLILIEITKDKKNAQSVLEKSIKSSLRCLGKKNVGHPGGNADQTIYSNGNRLLWVAFGGLTYDQPTLRYWNAFGVYDSKNKAQNITVEINIPVDSNTAQVSGFFAKDSRTGDVFLMHSGRIGGGRPGIGKSAFLVWSKANLVEVADAQGQIRHGIIVGKINQIDFVQNIEKFVLNVKKFKDYVISDEVGRDGFNKKVQEFDRYNKEFSGKKWGERSSEFEYITYHGDIVQKIYEKRMGELQKDEEVFNSVPIDLFVKKLGFITEIYEVKTGVGRQILYTAIGQLLTHSAIEGAEIKKFLVIPSAEKIPDDLIRAISFLDIQIYFFKVIRVGSKTIIELE
ncbi:hypothetical protein NKW45_00665 [Acetobacter orientalis]|uniref:hypothetical protein n=1 Tax=Acetobacter orientalis TaxID=146474 RepID=UPI0020A2ED7A|nr:hypothetical protein [Acetobacter orientalis]MCP1220360.1 hypothetical protein [Acetobacter orientalis]